MTAATAARPSLREVLAAALEDAYWYRRGEMDDCRACARNPASICGDHQADGDAAFEYEEARKQLERNPGHPEVLAVLAGIEGGEGND